MANRKMKTEIAIEDYNPLWPIEFQELSSVYASVLAGEVAAIAHVGSTAVPELCAKPILDIDIVLSDWNRLPAVIEKLGKIGYLHEGDLGIDGREAFKLVDQALFSEVFRKQAMDHHLYVCAIDSVELKRHIACRNHLRKYRDSAVEYGKLKRDLAERAESRNSYTAGKSAFIGMILAKEMDISSGKYIK